MYKLRKIAIFLGFIIALGLIFFVSYYLFFPILKSIDYLLTKSPHLESNKTQKQDGDISFTDAAFLSLIRDHSLKFLFFGDLMIDRHVKEKINESGLDHLLSGISDSIKIIDYDIISANLEGAVTDGGEHYAPANAYDFAFSPNLISEFKKYGFNSFTIANNHLADQGERGIIETRKNLSNLDLFYVGCIDQQVADCSIDIIRLHDKIVGLAGYSMVYGVLDEKSMLEQVSYLNSVSDLVIINIHWGTEYEHYFNSKQQQVGRSLIDAGADIVIGHHPHVVQGLEIYQNRPIFYSLGNYIFDQYFSSDTQEGLAVKIELKAQEIVIELMPFFSQMSRPEFLVDENKKRFFKKFLDWSVIDTKLKSDILNNSIFILNKK